MSNVKAQAQKKYLAEKVENATAIGRIVILLDACIRFLNEAKSSLAQNDKTLFCAKIIRAKNIVRELRNALNLDLEPEIAGNMYRLYTYFLTQLVEANRSKRTEPIDFVLKQLSAMNAAWREADAQGLGREVKRFEDRIGTGDPTIMRRVAPNAHYNRGAEQKSGDTLLETLNVKI